MDFSSDGKTRASASYDHPIKLWDVPTDDMNLAAHLSEDWLRMDGRHVAWPATSNRLGSETKFRFLNVSEFSHLGILQSGKPVEQVDEELFWAYVRATNWNSALVLFPSLANEEVREKGFATLLRWLAEPAEGQQVPASVAAVRLEQLAKLDVIRSNPQWNQAIDRVRRLPHRARLECRESGCSFSTAMPETIAPPACSHPAH
ncbi:MAG TPA: hypothetical protein VMN36_08345 [Verrucomicrobiales bacterium]|nr:hypothetical protein [Verrucomicrobiales bacterium]